MLRERYRAIDAAFGGYPHALHYALKANSTLAIARLLRELGSAVDANFGREIEVARRAGSSRRRSCSPASARRRRSSNRAVALGVKAINVESAGELARLEAIATRLGRSARRDSRQPGHRRQEPPAHFDRPQDQQVRRAARRGARAAADLRRRPSLTLVAVHVHVGSQITTLDPLRRAAAFIAGLAGELQQQGFPLEYVDLGGGLGVSYDGGDVPSAADYVSALVDAVRHTSLPIVLEPGRSIAAPAGALLARVIDVKPRTASSDFIIIDAGMTELMRPALYGAFHRIEPVSAPASGDHHYEIVGPVCESSDVVGRDRMLPPLEVGDLVAIRDAGAYGSAMASNYNRRPLPAEVLVDAGAWRVIRRRQTVDDMLTLES